MVLGDGIRRNIASVDPSERAMLIDAFIELNNKDTRVFPGSRDDRPAPGGVTWWFKQDEIHQATHVHNGPEFLPWHREIVNRLEDMLRQINPQLSLHYWDWTEDPRAIPNANLGGGTSGPLNLFTSDFMGLTGPTLATIGEPWASAGFYDFNAEEEGRPFRDDSVHSGIDDLNANPADPPSTLRRCIGCSPVFNSPLSADRDAEILDAVDYADMRDLLELAHNDMHTFVNMGGAHLSFRDPFVFLLHSNVDRLFARWQTDPDHPERLDPNTLYGSESNLTVIVEGIPQNVNNNVEPWSTGHSMNNVLGDIVEFFTRPWAAPESQGFPHTYKHQSIVTPPRYDTNFETSISLLDTLSRNNVPFPVSIRNLAQSLGLQPPISLRNLISKLS